MFACRASKAFRITNTDGKISGVDRRRHARRADCGRRRHQGGILERQLQGRARRDGHRQDPQALSAHRRHRRRRRGHVEHRSPLPRRRPRARHRLRPRRRAGRRLRGRSCACPPTGSCAFPTGSRRATRWCSAPPASPRVSPSCVSSAMASRRGRDRSPSPARPAASAASRSPRSRGSDTRSPRSPARTMRTTT